MNKKRLLKLADLLIADAKNKKGIKFDLGSWGYTGEDPRKVENPISCGTTACAMGLAALSGAFKRAGLTYSVSGGRHGMSYGICPRIGRRLGFSAAEKLFDIDGGEARWLFSTEYYENYEGAVSERVVAKRIRDFVAGKAAP